MWTTMCTTSTLSPGLCTVGPREDAAVRQLLPSPSPAGPSGSPAEVDPDAAYQRADRPAPDGRPWVLANFVASADGATTVEGRSGPLGSEADKAVFRILRGLADVILVGAGTVRAEGYGPARPTAPTREAREARGQRPVPPIAVVSGSLDLDLASSFFTEAVSRPVVVTHGASDPAARERLAELAEVVVAGDERVDLPAALAALRTHGPVLLTEGGPLLLGQLAADDLLDELCLTLSPLLAGGDGPRVTAGPPIDPPLPLELALLLEHHGELFLRYVRRLAH
jgi:riboflavin biosynthesis pyrimidine reductase